MMISPHDARMRARRAGALPVALVCSLAMVIVTLATTTDAAFASPERAAAGDHGHGTAGHGTAGHGHDTDSHGTAGHGAHAVPTINWTSFDYKGPEAKHHSPPFLFALINFAILLFILAKFAGPPLKKFLSERHHRVKKDLEEAARLREEARVRLAEIDRKLGGLDAEIKSIKQSVAEDAELEKRRIVEAAEREAEHLVEAAEKTLTQEVARIRRKLEVGAVRAAMEAAEKLLKQSVTTADHSRLQQEYFTQLSANDSPRAKN